MTATEPGLDSLSDDLLMLRYQAGEERAFDLLRERWQGRLLGLFVYNHRLDADTAEDLTQDVFVQLFRHRGSYDPKGRLAGWIFMIATRLAISEHRKRRVRGAVSLDDAQTLVDPNAKAERLAEINDSRERIFSALAKLSESYRQIIILREFEDLSYPEIAKVIGKPVTTVRVRLHRARAIFTRLMRQKLRTRRTS